jgi:hypothetical protein
MKLKGPLSFPDVNVYHEPAQPVPRGQDGDSLPLPAGPGAIGQQAGGDDRG